MMCREMFWMKKSKLDDIEKLTRQCNSLAAYIGKRYMVTSDVKVYFLQDFTTDERFVCFEFEQE